MIWTRLKNFKCPNCNQTLERGTLTHVCKNKKCKFKITVLRYDQMVLEMYQTHKPRKGEFDNLTELNNLDLDTFNTEEEEPLLEHEILDW